MILISGLAVFSQAQETPDIPELTEVSRAYFYKLQSIKAPAAYKHDSLRPKYLQILNHAEAKAKVAGDLEAVLAIQTERERFCDDPTFSPKKDKAPPAVVALRTPYQEGMARMNAAQTPALTAAAAAYAKQLEAITAALTRANRIEDAQYVKSQIGRIDRITGVKDYHPYLYPGTSRRTLTGSELRAEVANTRYRLSWLGGLAPGDQEAFLEFYPGGIYRLGLSDGKIIRGAFKADDRRRINLGSYLDVNWDASFTAFNFYGRDENGKRYRMRGQLEKRLDDRGADDNFLQDLLVYYSFDEVGQQIGDKSPNGNHGTGEHTMTYWAGVRKYAAFFAGRSHVALEGKIDPDDYAELSIAFWARPTGAFRGAYLVHWAGEGEHAGSYVKFSRNSLYYSFEAGREDDEYAPRDFQYKTHTWYHIVITHHRLGGNSLYVDGKRMHTHLAHPLTGNSNRLSIGSKVDLPEDEEDPEFIGMMDDLMIFKRALSPKEIATLYDWGKGE